MGAFQIRSLEIRVDQAPDAPEHAPTWREALLHGRAELRMGALAEDVTYDSSVPQEVGRRFASTRAWYDDLRTKGRMGDLYHQRAPRQLKVFGSTLAVDVVHARSKEWAQDEWAAMCEHVGAWGSHPVKDPGLPVRPACSRLAMHLQYVLYRVVRGFNVATRDELFDEALSLGGGALWVRPWFWRAPEGTWGRVAAQMWRLEEARR